MARHVWSVVCYKASIDNQDNNVSLLEVLEQITLQEDPFSADDASSQHGNVTPMLGAKHQLCTLWMRDDPRKPELSYTRMRVLSPQQQDIGSVVRSIDLRASRRSRMILQARALPYKGPGFYEFVVEWGAGENGPWSQVASIPLEVRLTDSGGSEE